MEEQVDSISAKNMKLWFGILVLTAIIALSQCNDDDDALLAKRKPNRK